MLAWNADGTLWPNCRSVKLRLGARVSTIKVVAVTEGGHYILLDIADARCEAKCVSRALVRSVMVALVTMVFIPREEEDVVSARALIALAFECGADTV